MFIIMQILYYSESKPYAFAFGSFCWTALVAIYWHHIPNGRIGTASSSYSAHHILIQGTHFKLFL